MGKYSNLSFDGKHIDEKILYFANPSKIQLKLELFKISIPFLLIIGIFLASFFYSLINIFVFIISSILLFILFSFSIFYKIYRTKNNYIYITSKRILFHGMNGLFKDYIKKINYENIRNINYFTTSFFGKIFGYGSIEIQSSHGGAGDITVYHMKHGKMLAHFIDKLVSISKEERENFPEFDENYFKNFKK